MKSSEIRSSFVDFFVNKGHKHISSAPLVPVGDHTLLFTNAGMVQFKDYFTGKVKPPLKRAVTVQKCLRVSGKHADLENVGPSDRHHTFFEMLGNFSFGDYFKEQAIEYAWELVTNIWEIKKDQIFVSIFKDDEEAYKLWRKVAGLTEDKIVRLGEEDNFWAMGDTGPCGPCSEIYVDRQPTYPRLEVEKGCESGRYIEVWNLVFMQYERDISGALKPLPKPSIDTGAGLERVAAVLQGVTSNYQTDLFVPIISALENIFNRKYGNNTSTDVSFRVISDHIRAITFLIADGVVPSSEGRGYVLRRILRRAVRHGMKLGKEEPFLFSLVDTVVEIMGSFYGELYDSADSAKRIIEKEEQKFLGTLANAARMLQQWVDEARSQGKKELSGDKIFKLYDTYGMPIDIAKEMLEEERMSFDAVEFENLLQLQRKRARVATAKKISQRELLENLIKDLNLPKTEFVGYDLLKERARILALIRKDENFYEKVNGLSAGENGLIILDKTVFYAEGGGQVGDRGKLSTSGGEVEVVDTQRIGDVVVHFVYCVKGTICTGENSILEVDKERRLNTQRNHTATHLLHAALRKVLGRQVKQAGSLVAPDRLRFDFTWDGKVESEELAEIERTVSRWILENREVIKKYEPLRDALSRGAIALFGEKYGDIVRTVEIPGISLELCGGCHVDRIGEIGPFIITSSKGIGSGIRRIEAITGDASIGWIYDKKNKLSRLESILGVPEGEVEQSILSLIKEANDLRREVEYLRRKLVYGGGIDRYSDSFFALVWGEKLDRSSMRDLARKLARDQKGIGFVISTHDDKFAAVVAVDQSFLDKVSAREVIKDTLSGFGKGGGKKDLAEGGGRFTNKEDFKKAVVERLRKLVSIFSIQ